ncbi:hypothetical protein D3C71_859200 [compost metagenome]
MAVGLADLGRFRRAVNAVGRLRQGNPDRADRAVRTRRDLQDLVVLALLEVDFRIVGVARIERDALHRMRAARRRRIRGADGGGIGGDQIAVLTISEDLFDALVCNDTGDLPLLRLTRIDHLDDGAGHGEIDAGVQFLQVVLIHVEAFGQRLGRGGEGEGRQL